MNRFPMSDRFDSITMRYTTYVVVFLVVDWFMPVEPDPV